MSIESPIPTTFLPIEIELNSSVIRVPIHFYSAPPGTETLIYHLMDLFIFYLTPYTHAEWNLAFRKFSVLSYVKEILVDNKHLKHHHYEKVSFEIEYAIVFRLRRLPFIRNKMMAINT